MSEEKEYAKDSTRGSSVMNPLNYKGDVLVQVWLDSRVIATLGQWLEKCGTYPRFMSQVVRVPLEALVTQLTEDGEVELIDDTAVARAMLENRFGVKLNRGGRGKKNALHNQILSDRRGSLREKISSARQLDDAHRPLGKTKRRPRKSIEEALERAEERIKGVEEKEFRKAAKEAIEVAKESGQVVTRKSDVPRKMTAEEIERKAEEIEERDRKSQVEENAPVDVEELVKGAIKE